MAAVISGAAALASGWSTLPVRGRRTSLPGPLAYFLTGRERIERYGAAVSFDYSVHDLRDFGVVEK